MTEPHPPTLRSIDELVTSIRALKPSIEALADPFRQTIERQSKTVPDPRVSSDYWILVVHADSLVRIRLFTEQNFIYIESVGLLGVTRYLFELVVWLRLMRRDSRYGLVYYHELLEKQRRYYSDLKGHLMREISLLRAAGVEEDRLMQQRLAEAQRLTDQAVATKAMQEALQDIADEIDGKVARAFSLYGDQARTNGYNFQAFWVETKVLPKVAASLSVLEQDLHALKNGLSPEVRSLIPKPWKWRDQAGLVGMTEEYDFIYTYTSRLLHATPASLTTDQKNLENDEVRLFLKYCHVRLLDVIDMAKAALAGSL